MIKISSLFKRIMKRKSHIDSTEENLDEDEEPPGKGNNNSKLNIIDSEILEEDFREEQKPDTLEDFALDFELEDFREELYPHEEVYNPSKELEARYQNYDSDNKISESSENDSFGLKEFKEELDSSEDADYNIHPLHNYKISKKSIFENSRLYPTDDFDDPNLS